MACALSLPQYYIFPQFRNFEPQCLWGFIVVYHIFLSFNVLELPGPVLAQSRLHQDWQERFAIQFTSVTTKEMAAISVNLSCKVAAASVVTF